MSGSFAKKVHCERRLRQVALRGIFLTQILTLGQSSSRRYKKRNHP